MGIVAACCKHGDCRSLLCRMYLDKQLLNPRTPAEPSASSRPERMWSLCVRNISLSIVISIVVAIGCTRPPRNTPSTVRDLNMSFEVSRCDGYSVVRPDSSLLDIHTSLAPRDGADAIDAVLKITYKESEVIIMGPRITSARAQYTTVPGRVDLQLVQRGYVMAPVTVELNGGCNHVMNFVLRKYPYQS